MSLSPEKCVFLKEKLYIFILASFFFFSFPFYLVNQPSSSLSSSPLSFSSLLRASAPASHQHQRPGSARRVKAGGGLSPTIYVCSFCARLCVCVWTWSPQTFMCLFFIISNNFAPHLSHYLAPLLPALHLPGCCVQLWALIYFSVTHNYTPERARLMSLSAIMAQRCSPPFLDPLRRIQYNYYLLKISPALPPSPCTLFWLMHLSPTDRWVWICFNMLLICSFLQCVQGSQTILL